MPIRINLKELFGSDSQEVTVDKVNFNFNRLLELGIGLDGPVGITGPIGGAGPSGPIGPQGDRGNYWFVGAGNPNLSSFPTANHEDFYINSDDSQIWQYDANTDTWNLLIDLGGVVNNYLATQGTTFVRGFGEGSPADSRFIVFPNRGNSTTDFTGDKQGSSSVNNDILLLSNFNETTSGQSAAFDISQDLTNTDDLYNALQKIYVNVTNTLNPARHALEVGSLFDWTDNSIPGAHLTEFNENLKLHHIGYSMPSNYIGVITEDVHGNIDINNESVTKLTKGILSVTGDPLSPSSDKHQQLSMFELRTGAWDRAGGGFGSLFNVQIGARQTLVEEAGYIKFDGINFQNAEGENAGIGLAPNFAHKLSELDGEAFLMLDADASTGGILLKTDTYQDFGNIEQLGTGDPSMDSSNFNYTTGSSQLANDNSTYGNGAILNSGNNLHIIQSQGSTLMAGGTPPQTQIYTGRFYTLDISNPTNPSVLFKTEMNHTYEILGNKTPVGVGVKDADHGGSHIVTITDLSDDIYNVPLPLGQDYTKLQVLKVGKSGIYAVGEINNGSIKGGYRINLIGTSAIIFGNRLRNLDQSSNFSTSTYADGGSVNIVDISDPTSPTEVVSNSTPNVHFLDSSLMGGNVAMGLAIELDTNTSSGFNDIKLKLKSYEIDNNDILNESELDLGVTFQTVSGSNYENPSTWSIYGSVVCSGNKIYAAYRNILYIAEYSDLSTGKIALIQTYQFDSDPDIRSLDIKLSGSDLYILGGTGGTQHWAPTMTKLVKLSVRTETSPELINSFITNEPSPTKMEIVGNVIYLNKVDGPDGIVIPIEIDGFKTNSANIGKIKANDISIADTANIGNSLSVEKGINVGDGGIQTSGNISAQDAKFIDVVCEDLTAEDAEVETLHITDLTTGNSNVDNVLVATSAGLVREVDPAVLVANSGNGVPCGVIVMWYGSIPSIPNGWHLCDGTKGTPDLTDRFVIGAGGAYDPPTADGSGPVSAIGTSGAGDTGGEESVLLTSLESGTQQHLHEIAEHDTVTAGQHRHETKIHENKGNEESGNGIAATSSADNAQDGQGTSGEQWTELGRMSHAGNHSHQILAHDTLHKAGTPADTSHENRPPYYALCFIMKCDLTATSSGGGQQSSSTSKQGNATQQATSQVQQSSQTTTGTNTTKSTDAQSTSSAEDGKTIGAPGSISSDNLEGDTATAKGGNDFSETGETTNAVDFNEDDLTGNDSDNITDTGAGG